MATKVEAGKSRRWYDAHCAICCKTFGISEDRVKGHCVFKNDQELDFLACERCAKQADIVTAIEQTIELGKHDAHKENIQPETKEVPQDKPTEEPKPVVKGHGRKRVDKKPVKKLST